MNRYGRLVKTVAYTVIAHDRPSALSKNSKSKVDTQNDAHSESLHAEMNGQLGSNTAAKKRSSVLYLVNLITLTLA